MESALGGKPSRTRNVFVIAQIAGSTFFVVAALLFARSVTKTQAVPTGFDTEHTIALGLTPDSTATTPCAAASRSIRCRRS